MVQGLIWGMDRRSRRWVCRIAGFALIATVAAVLPAPMHATFAATGIETELETVRFGRGDSLSALLSQAGVSARDADRIGKAIQRKTNLRRMRIGREMRLLFKVEGERSRIPLAVSVEIGRGRFVEATRTAKGGYKARPTTIPLTRPIPLSEVVFDRDGRTVTVRRNETISGILRRHGVNSETVDAVVGALRTDFDPRDLMPGDTIAIAVERDADGAPLLRGIAIYLDDDRAVAVVRTDGGGFAAHRTTGAALRSAGLVPAAAPSVGDALTPPQKPTRMTVETPLPDAERASATTPPDKARQKAVEPELIELRRTLHAGNTLMDLLLDADVRRSEADALVRSLRRVFNPRRLPAGIAVRVTKRPVPGFEPRIAWLDVELPQGRRIRVERGDKGHFSSWITDKPPPPAEPRAVASAAAEDRSSARSTKPAAAAGNQPATAAAASHAPEPLPPSAKRITVRSGDTLMAILRRHGIDRVEADRAIQAARKLFNLRRLRIGQEITLVTGIDETGADTLKAVALRVGDDRFVKVTRAAGGLFVAAKVNQLALIGAPLQRTGAASALPDAERRRDHAGVDGRGQVMNGAFVAAAAPITAAPVGPTPQPAAKAAKVNGTVNDAVGGLVEGNNGLVQKAVVIRKGDTLSDALTRAGGTRTESEAAIVAFRKVHNPRRLRVGQTLSLSFDTVNGSSGDFQLASVALDVAADRDVVVTRGEGGIFLPSVVDRPLDRVLERTVGTIYSSLYVSALDAGMPNQVLMEMVHIFSFDVDFQREIQPGDRFEVLYEAVYNTAGDFVENGPILYATLDAGKRTVELFRYEPDGGPADYLDARGASVRKALMRTPINGARLSSGFGERRHPILGYNKKHLGVDFAAPTGTPIFAAGDGTISMIGRHGNYGNYVRVRHNGTYSTGYAHLNGYAKGIRKGKRVRQGQVIAYVGSTGMSTGPHLHYEVMKGNSRINPMTLKLPSGRKLAGHELALFQQQVQKISVLLAEVPALTRVAHR